MIEELLININFVEFNHIIEEIKDLLTIIISGLMRSFGSYD